VTSDRRVPLFYFQKLQIIAWATAYLKVIFPDKKGAGHPLRHKYQSLIETEIHLEIYCVHAFCFGVRCDEIYILAIVIDDDSRKRPLPFLLLKSLGELFKSLVGFESRLGCIPYQAV
jgi:hypothetical protein